MSNGPQLINGRDRFACGTFEFGAKTMAIVAGGVDGKSSVSTEIWDPMSENGWVVGKYYFFVSKSKNVNKQH